jgi:integrase
VFGFRFYVDGLEKKSKPYPTLRDARAAKAQHDVKMQRGDYVDSSRLTFEQAADAYMSEITYIRPGTRKIYNAHLKHILPELGTMRMQSIRASDIIEFLGNKKQLAPRSRQRMLGFISQVFQWAIRRELVTKNPCQALTRQERPQVLDGRERVLTEQEVLDLAEAIGPRFRTFVLLLALSGLRMSEALALKWTDVDFEAGVIRIERAVTHGKNAIGDVKGSGSRRKVNMPPRLEAELRAHRATEAERSAGPVSANGRFLENGRTATWKVRAGVADEYVFDFSHGIFYSAFAVARAAVGLTRRTPAGLHEVTPHTFRHTYGSMLISRGVDPVTVSKLMGHASPKTTMEVYAHEFDSQRARMEAMALLDAAYEAAGDPARFAEPGRVLAGSRVRAALPAA